VTVGLSARILQVPVGTAPAQESHRRIHPRVPSQVWQETSTVWV
jgi:hypothetical protein